MAEIDYDLICRDDAWAALHRAAEAATRAAERFNEALRNDTDATKPTED